MVGASVHFAQGDRAELRIRHSHSAGGGTVNERFYDYREKSERLHELMTMQRNYQMAIQPQQPKHRRKHETEL